MRRDLVLSVFSGFALSVISMPAPGAAAEEFLEVPSDVLEDRIRGGLLGQILGNLNGLPHEMKYIHEPGEVKSYTPSLPDGARTDDDTDLEWVYLTEMDRSGRIFLPSARIAELWRAHINRSIWCANRYARDLMDLGIEPPLTGRIALNPWSVFNISGQFVCESFGLIAPAMPQTAARIGLRYTHVTIDGEPAQATQLFTAMIATAFLLKDVEALVDAGLAAVDPKSEIHRIVVEVRRLWKENPDDWRSTRRAIQKAYTRHKGAVRDSNGYELNTAATVAALLYGRGDFAETLRLAFNFGWDADNNAATCGAIIGVIRGRRWMESRGWKIGDPYKNITRDGMPEDETITGFGDKLARVARMVIKGGGGEDVSAGDRRMLRICLEVPENVEPLPRPLDRLEELRNQLLPGLEKDLAGSRVDRARAAYLALCLGEAERLRRERPDDWVKALEALKSCPAVIRNIFSSPEPSGDRIRRAATAAGLRKPPP